MPITNFEPQKPKLTYLSVTGKANCYIQCQSTPIRINFHLLKWKKTKNFMFQVCYVTSEFSKHIRVNENLFVWALTGIVYSNLLYRLPTSRLILAFGVQNL